MFVADPSPVPPAPPAGLAPAARTPSTQVPQNAATRAAPNAGLELARRALAGEAHAFEDIMRRYNRLLFRSARGITSDDAQAQDVVQEAYLQAFLHLDTFRGESELGTWLVRITIRVALQAQRRRGHLVQLEDGWDSADLGCAETEMPNQFLAPEPPDHAAERGEVRVLLQAAIEDLPVIYRSVFLLRAVENLPVEEVSLCLGVSEAVVKTRYLRARALLRDTLVERLDVDALSTFAFAGARCDAVVAHVMARLREQGLTR